MLVTGKEVLVPAQKKGYAVCAFNVYNLETLQSVIRGAEKLKSPVIVQTSESALEYAGLPMIAEMIELASKSAKVPVVLIRESLRFHRTHAPI